MHKKDEDLRLDRIVRGQETLRGSSAVNLAQTTDQRRELYFAAERERARRVAIYAAQHERGEKIQYIRPGDPQG